MVILTWSSKAKEQINHFYFMYATPACITQIHPSTRDVILSSLFSAAFYPLPL